MKRLEILEDTEIEVLDKELYSISFPLSSGKKTLMQNMNPGKYLLRVDGVIVPEHHQCTTSWKLKFQCLP